MKASPNRFFIAGLVLAALAATQTCYASGDSIGAQRGNERGAPVNVIFDTDMWSDIDDALALAMLHALQDRNEIHLVAVTVSTDEKWCAPYVDLLNTFYGHAGIPIGVVHNGMNTEAFRKKIPEQTWPVTEYTRLLSQRTNKEGSLVYPHRMTDGAQAPEAVWLLRKTLAAQPDGSVVVIQVGYSTNLARMLDSGADALSTLSGRDLVRRKVRFLSIMAGNFGTSKLGGTTFPKGAPEFNVRADVAAAQKLFADWPTPIVASGFEIGITMLFPARSIEEDYSYVKNHPIAETYRVYSNELKAWPHDHLTCDLTSVLYAARPDRDYFSLSKPGKISVLEDGSPRFKEAEGGSHRYLILGGQQKARTLEAMVMLASQPPSRRSP
jgi:purine nucleosidase